MIESVGIGSDLEVLERTKNFGREIPIDDVEGQYYVFSIDYGLLVRLMLDVMIKGNILEINDSDLRTLALQSGSYDFWNDPSEDIYTMSDGEPV